MGLAWGMPDDEQRRTPPTFQDMSPGFPEPVFEPLTFERVTPDESLHRAEGFYRSMHSRRSTRHFSSEPVSRAIIEQLILTAGTAPSGAHRQPWRFVAVQDAGLKAQYSRGGGNRGRAHLQPADAG